MRQIGYRHIPGSVAKNRFHDNNGELHHPLVHVPGRKARRQLLHVAEEVGIE